MKSRIFGLLLLAVGLAGTPQALHAAVGTARARVVLPYDILDPSVDLAQRIQKRGDYVTAVLLNEAILKRDPSDQQTLRRMVECHEAIVKKEGSEKQVSVMPKRERDDDLSELPNLIPNQAADAKKPTEDPHRRLL